MASFARGCTLVFNFVIIPPVAATLVVIIATLWFYYSGTYDSTLKRIHKVQSNISTAAGLTLDDILLEGQIHTPQEEILRAISKSGFKDRSLNVGEPLLNVNLWKIKDRLEELTWIKHASVERQYPSTLSVSITERTPVALWQNSGKVNLIDDEGEIIGDVNLENFKNLIIMVGKDAPSHTASIFELIKSQPTLADKVSSVIRISDRRWNIRTRNDIEIKLPEEDPEKAWKYLAQVQKDSNILDSNIKNIDLRVEEKMFVK
ncbi:MAG: putative Cell division protein FtsQ [Rickettsiaceae bacterium]|nr:putative Cell division protein FtsQ [Rickettsiaceae bacterium]